MQKVINGCGNGITFCWGVGGNQKKKNYKSLLLLFVQINIIIIYIS